MYAGPGVAVGIGESGGWWYRNENKVWFKEANDIGFGVKTFWNKYNSEKYSTRFFGEIGVMVGVLPCYTYNAEAQLFQILLLIDIEKSKLNVKKPV